MGKFCIPKHLVEKFNNTVLKDNFDMDVLNNMTSKESKEFFIKHTDEDLGSFLNAKWEKAKVSEHETAILDFVKSIYEPKQYTEKVKSNVASKVNTFIKNGVFSAKAQNNLLESLIEEEMGISLSNEEIQKIVEKSNVLNESLDKVIGMEVSKDEDGNPIVDEDGKVVMKRGDGKLGDADKMQETIEFMNNLSKMNDYIDSLTPSNAVEIFFGQIGILNMVFSTSSLSLNIVSGGVTILPEYLSKKLVRGVSEVVTTKDIKNIVLPFKGANDDLAKMYAKMHHTIYINTGYDVTRMESIEDLGQYGSRMMGETSKVHAQGRTSNVLGNFTRWYARGLQKTVGKYGLGYPDFRFSNATFVSTINTGALSLAKGDKKLGTHIMEDAFRFSPLTEEGVALRAQAILDAQTVTNTGKTWASNLSMNIKKAFNDMSPLRPGDWMIPFAKTTSNLVTMGTNYSGLGSVIDLGNIVLGKHKGVKISKAHWEHMGQNIVRAGMGILAARLLVSMIDDDDFSPMFSFGAQQLDTLKNAPENSIRVGGQWISLDYFGPFSIPLTAALYGRRITKSNDPRDSFLYDIQSTVASIGQSLPISDPIANVFKFFTNDANREKDPIKEMTASVSDFIGDLYGRAVPSFVSQIAKVIDIKERESAKSFLGNVQSRLPGFRMMLPEKKNIFGEDIGDKSIPERAFHITLFGSRMKSDQSTQIVSELSRISLSNGKNINFMDMRKSSSMELAQFRNKVGEAMYKDATTEYGQKLEQLLDKEISSKNYKKMNDEERYKKITSLDAEALKSIYKKYHFTYKRAK